MRILLVEDDERLAELTSEYLEIQGYEVCWEVRQHYSGVILMLTARDEDLDQIPGPNSAPMTTSPR
jgi:DNA-binding response OmpR family regulator